MYLDTGRLEYDIDLGSKALDAILAIGKALGENTLQKNNDALQMGIDYCRATRDKYSYITTIPADLPEDARYFLQAVKETRPPSPHQIAKIAAMDELEPLLSKILSEQRIPTEEERLDIMRKISHSSAGTYQ